MIQLARKAKLVLLQLGETVNHKGIFEVGSDQGLKNIHVVSGELSEAVIQVSTKFTISGDFSILNTSTNHLRFP